MTCWICCVTAGQLMLSDCQRKPNRATDLKRQFGTKKKTQTNKTKHEYTKRHYLGSSMNFKINVALKYIWGQV